MKPSLHIQRLTLALSLALACAMRTQAQVMAIRNNVLQDALMTPNLGFELVVGEKKTISANLMGNYKPLGKDMKMIFLQPEFRYYFSGRPMFKHFIGLGAVAGSYDITWKGKVYDGVALGGGITLGYVYKLSQRLNVDFHTGFGAIAYKQKEYFVGDHYDQDYSEGTSQRTNALGYTLLPTNVGVSLTYILK